MADEIVASGAHEIDWRCGTCRFYDRKNETHRDLISDRELHKDDYESECRRFPPVRGDAEYCGEMVGCEVLSALYCWPTVRSVDWCGEWASRDRAPEAVGNAKGVDVENKSILLAKLDHYEFNFTVRTINALAEAGVESIGDLVKRREPELWATPGIGRKAIIEIRENLANHGLSLGSKL
jgi:hypothetical protein